MSDLVKLVGELTAVRGQRDALMVEVERLRDHVKFLNSFRPDAELAKRDAEIERLRGAYEQERKDCINLTEKVMPNLRAEIERLRALLREGLQHHDEYNWQQRVREALGD